MKKKTKRTMQQYSPELRSEAVRLVLEQGLTQGEASQRLTVPKGTIANWVAAAKQGRGPVSGARTAQELEGEPQRVGGSEAGAGNPKKSRSVLCQGVTARYAFMKKWREVFPVDLMSRVLEVSRSGYYDWLGRGPSARAREDERLKIEIRAAHQRSRETYGPRRLQPELTVIGVQAGRDRIARLRRSMGLYCRQRR